MHALENRAQTTRLYQRFEQINLTLGAMRDSLDGLSVTQNISYSKDSRAKIQTVCENILGSILLLMVSLQQLIRELV
jgi:hypothetical protein